MHSINLHSNIKLLRNILIRLNLEHRTKFWHLIGTSARVSENSVILLADVLGVVVYVDQS